MMTATTTVVALLCLISMNAQAGENTFEKARKKIATMGRFSKALFPDEGETQSKSFRTARSYSGPRFYQSLTGSEAQIDQAEFNTTVWGIYGPGRNLVHDPITGRLTAGWSRTPSSGKPRTIYAASSSDGGAGWTLQGPLDDQSASSSRGYFAATFRAKGMSVDSTVKDTEWVVWSERDVDRVDITHDTAPGLLFFDPPKTIMDTSNVADPNLTMVFTFAAAADNDSGHSTIYITQYQSTGSDSTSDDNILFVKSTDSGISWSTPEYIFGNADGQIPLRYSVARFPGFQGNASALAMAINPNNPDHIGGLFLSRWIENEGSLPDDSLLRPFGYGVADYHYYFTESTDGGDSWSTPEMLLGRDPKAREQWEYRVTLDTTGNDTADLDNPAYLYGGTNFWAFLTEPVFTSDGAFHAAIMPVIKEVPATENQRILKDDEGRPLSLHRPVVYSRRTSAKKWDYVTDLAGHEFAFDRFGNAIDPLIGQAWFAEMSKGPNDIIGISWSSRLQAYSTIGSASIPQKGALVVAGSPDQGVTWTAAKAFFPPALPVRSGDRDDQTGGWPGSSVSSRMVKVPDTTGVYSFEFIYQSLGRDNVTLSGTETSFVAGGGIGIWYTDEPHVDMSEAVITSVESDRSNIPVNFALEQNYPNPFNPITTIAYSLVANSVVTLDVYNMLGQKIITLVDQKVQAGNHTVTWDATSNPSGVYFYKLQSDDFSQTKKMLLLK